jgi:N-dimethylarginine dimethylaminohydrolase
MLCSEIGRMTYSVHQHWDPLRTCVLGRSYPPEFYSWIQVPKVRNLFEQIAIETEEDFQLINKKLQEFGVEVLRPEIPEQDPHSRNFHPPPMTPRDYMIMIGQDFYEHFTLDLAGSYIRCRDPSWPECQNWKDWSRLPPHIIEELRTVHGISIQGTWLQHCYRPILDRIRAQGNNIYSHAFTSNFNGATISRVGKDLYFGTMPDFDCSAVARQIQDRFPGYRTHIVDTDGHADSTYCPVAPGLIISLRDVPTYAETFPDWEVVYLEHQSWTMVKPFIDLKKRNQGRWWIPGFEYDNDVINVVETWMNHWVGYVEETVFDVNMLVLDPKNVLLFNHNDRVFEALDRHGITPHVVTFRHRYFWDGGIHCVTSDLDRIGHCQDFFPGRV